MREKLELDGFDRRRLEITVHEVSRLEGILRQLLDVARPLTITTASVNLSALAEGCVDLLEPKAHEKGLEFVERYSKSLPPAHVDAGKVEQALINLLLNAIEATPEGGRITVWTRTARKGNQCLEIGVKDTGHGIDRDQMADLFTPFLPARARGADWA